MNELRENLKRVNIVLTKEQAERYTEFAKKCHGSRSQFLRMAAENAIERGQNGGGTAEIDVTLRPLVERLEEVEKAVKRIENRLVKTEKGVDFLVDKSGSRIDKVADDVEKVLEEHGGELGVPDIGDLLPYTQSEIIRGLEKLEEEFAVKRAENEKGIPKWRIRGETDGK